MATARSTKRAGTGAAVPARKKAAKKPASAPGRKPSAPESGQAEGASAVFEGFPRGGDAFFDELAANQDREWFQANKARFESLWQTPIHALIDALAERLEPVFPGASQTKRKVFRIYRDVRFSADKSPYKNHVGAILHLTPGAGPEMASLVVYAHFEARSQFVGVGWYELPKVELERFRKAVAGPPGEALAAHVAALEKKKFSVMARESHKRVPAGFPQDHPRAELLKRKGFTVLLPPMPKGLVAKPELVEWIVERLAETRPAVDWLRTHVMVRP